MPPISTKTFDVLLDLAIRSIAHGLEHDQLINTALLPRDGALAETRATFVTLHKDDRLRGCIGSLEAKRSLAEDVAANAYAAAFSDPRFPKMEKTEFAQVDLHLSVLSPLSPIQFVGHDDLMAKIRPGVDGLVIFHDVHQATFLPSVWENLPDAEMFLSQLRLKAGIEPGVKTEQLRVSRYHVESCELKYKKRKGA